MFDILIFRYTYLGKKQQSLCQIGNKAHSAVVVTAKPVSVECFVRHVWSTKMLKVSIKMDYFTAFWLVSFHGLRSFCFVVRPGKFLWIISLKWKAKSQSFIRKMNLHILWMVFKTYIFPGRLMGLKEMLLEIQDVPFAVFLALIARLEPKSKLKEATNE